MSENEKKDELVETPAPAEEKVKKSKDEKGKTDEKKSKPGFFKRVGKWFKEMKSELKKVQWPGWKTVAKNTGIVVVCVIIIGIFIWLFDWLAHAIIGALLALFGKA